MNTNYIKYIRNFDSSDLSLFLILSAAFVPIALLLKVVIPEMTMLDGFTSVASGGALATALRRGYVNYLTELIESPRDEHWEFSLNGIRVGSIRDADYAKFRVKAFSEPLNYVLHIYGVYAQIVRIFFEIMKNVPIAAFWFALAIAYFDPQLIADVWNSSHQITPDVVKTVLRNLASLFWILVMIIIGLKMISNTVWVKHNGFSADIAKDLRKDFNQVADGEIEVTRLTKDIHPQVSEQH